MSQELATMSLNEVPEFLKKIEAQLAGLKSMAETKWKTKGVLHGFSTNLQEVAEVEDVVKMFSSVLGRKKMFDEAQTILGVKTVKVFRCEGSTIEEWEADCKFRIAIITEHETREKLLKAKEMATTLLSDEDKKRMAMQNLQELLQGIQ